MPRRADMYSFVWMRPGMYFGALDPLGQIDYLRRCALELFEFFRGGLVRMRIELLPAGEFCWILWASDCREDLARRFTWFDSSWSLGLLQAAFAEMCVEMPLAGRWAKRRYSGGWQRSLELEEPLENKDLYEYRISGRWDVRVFSDGSLRFFDLVACLETYSHLWAEVAIEVCDHRSVPSQRLCIEPKPNIAGLLRYRDRQWERSLFVEIRQGRRRLELAMDLRWCDSREPPLQRSFAFGEETAQHGSAVEGMLAGFMQALREFAHSQGERPNTRGQVRAQMAWVLAIWAEADERRYAGATRAKLDSPALFRWTKRVCYPYFLRFLQQNPDHLYNSYWRW